MSVSVLILTFNEEICLPKAIESVINWSDDIVVLDSGSTDSTGSIVKSYENVRFIVNDFSDFASQRNFGLHKIKYINDWVLLLDSDEICPKNLQTEINKKIKHSNQNEVCFILQRKDFINNRWIKIHADGWFERLVRPQFVEFKGKVHEKLFISGNQGKLEEYLWHYPMAKGIHHWIIRHSKYAEVMARQEIHNEFSIDFKNLFSSNPVNRFRALKTIYLHLPGRWFIFFFHRLFLRGGLLSGIDGIYFTILETFYHFLVVANIRALKEETR